MISNQNIFRYWIKKLILLSYIGKISILFIIISFLISSCTPQIRFASKEKDLSRTVIGGKKAKEKTSNQQYVSTDSKFDFSIIDNYSNLDIKRKEVLTFAESYIGTPYCYGGVDKNCTDCSGFVKQIYDMAGINLPRTAALQYEYGKEIMPEETKPGDLVFFKRSSKISHVGIFLGNNQFIHASTNKGVVVQSLEDAFYKQNLAGFRKVLN